MMTNEYVDVLAYPLIYLRVLQMYIHVNEFIYHIYFFSFKSKLCNNILQTHLQFIDKQRLKIVFIYNGKTKPKIFIKLIKVFLYYGF